MKVIDFEKKGNVIRFYLGEKTDEWGWTNPIYKIENSNGEEETPDWLEPCDTYWGDDWGDVPYECNAGRVYDEFIKAYMDIAIPFDAYVLEPCDEWGNGNSLYSKEDFIKKKAPCLVVIQPEQAKQYFGEPAYSSALGNSAAQRVYFGDDEKDAMKIGMLLKHMKVNVSSWSDHDD